MSKRILQILVATVTILGLVIVGRYIYYGLTLPSTQGPSSGIIPVPTGKRCIANKISQEEAFLILSSGRDKINLINEPGSIEIKDIPEDDIEKIALAYEVIDENECGPNIYVKLQKGKFLQLTGKNWERWYFTISGCVNNKRVAIDAITGEQAGPIHTHVVCGGVI